MPERVEIAGLIEQACMTLYDTDQLHKIVELMARELDRLKEQRQFVEFIKAADPKIIACRPGDKVVLRVPAAMSRDARANCTKALAGYFPDNEVLILDGGMDIEVVRDGDDTAH